MPDYDATAFNQCLGQLLEGSLAPIFHYQPIADLHKGHVVGYEALVRFPAAMQMPPDRVFQMAQSLGKRLGIEEVVSRAVFSGRGLLPQDCFLTVNISSLFLLSEGWDRVMSDVTGLERIVIEITEGDRIDDYPQMRKHMDRVRTMGGTIAIDDTGSGYASLKHVMELRPDFIKLDRFFVENCHAERAKSALIRTLCNAAFSLNASVIAEGIETQDEVGELIQLAVPLGQGYFLGRPAPVMHTLPLELATSIRARVQAVAQACSVESLITHCVTCGSAAEAQELVTSGSTLCAVVVNEHGHPTALIELHAHLGVRSVPDLVCVPKNCSLRDLVESALRRPADLRYDNVVAVDDKGVLTGVLLLHELLLAQFCA